jgi:CheY-specific phosphatase CheX
MKEDIYAAREQISTVVRQAMEETFNTMFKLAVLNDPAPLMAPAEIVMAYVKLNHGETDMDFSFRFDMQLLLQAAASIFRPEYLGAASPHADIACEVANIVCHRVKAYLNEEGCHTDMGFPFVLEPGQNPPPERGEPVHMHFFYRDKDARRRVGVAVNFIVA